MPFIYELECKTCNGSMTYEAGIDSDQDLCITAECTDCTQKLEDNEVRIDELEDIESTLTDRVAELEQELEDKE